MNLSSEYSPYKTDAILQENFLKTADLVKKSFSKIATFWPLENLIAVNPLQGLEDLPIEEALQIGSVYFEKPNIPKAMEAVNIQTIKWLSAYCDEGQATITMPFRNMGLYQAFKKLAIYDEKIHFNRKENIAFLKNLPQDPEHAIDQCLSFLRIIKNDALEFITLLLTTLHGWASYVKYKSNSSNMIQVDYIAYRLIIMSLLWPQGKVLVDWHKKNLSNSTTGFLDKIKQTEKAYQIPLLKKLAGQSIRITYGSEMHSRTQPQAQLVFCIDVRSEPLRRALESTGNYQTFGFAGFFGIPLSIENQLTGATYSSCPVLLEPKHKAIQNRPVQQTFFKKIYQSLKYNFSTPFALAETLGAFAGLWMGLKTFFPKWASGIKNLFIKPDDSSIYLEPSDKNISLTEKCNYAENVLRMIGLVDNFAPVIVFCGHGSKTENNAYASALDCGACGGKRGGNNAQILASIINLSEVRTELAKNGILIPKETVFIAAEHNTTTHEITLYSNQVLNTVYSGLKRAQYPALDWAEVRPEWGLARNAAFIIGPRELSSSLDLDGRCFLHSYDYKIDPQGIFLRTILTAPMIVAEWINMQYFFSTLNNISYGGG
ncbi:MAG: putative inorganic carbon transporter subunit DabA, partial [Gammaproteobacteria bacterium]